MITAAACAAALLCASGAARADCIDDAAAFQHVNVSLMRGIAQVESGMQPNRVNTNSNGTTDIGLMQINSSWLPVLAREGITEQSLFDPCTNAYVGAWILSENIRQFGPNWNAVGAYNAASPDKRLSYARKVYDAVQSISASPDSSMPILPPSFTPPQTYSPFTSLEVTPVQTTGRPRAGTPAGMPSGVPAGVPSATNASSSTIAASAAYNFGWTVTGADQAKPVQVFDDGAKVFVQFIDMKHIPAIFAETPNGRVLLRWDLQFPYAVIARAEQTLIFQSGTFEARAVRTPGTAQASALTGNAGAATAASKSAANATATANSTATATASSTAPKPRDDKAARAAATDAMWYINLPATGRPQTDTRQPAAQLAPQPAPQAAQAMQTVAQPPAPTPPAAAPQKAKPAPSTDALWYINTK
ncbi:transglycosylase SLT domain-containing protein [Paraburkholderia sp. D15]|uniref:lytic transglycosylase domain-containing protein n=1 Tax=Paraburkholderia sp. D15 TaxID=2880218 RepID=UPI002479C2F2|nr:transglycosylase SLT domain-containing protein [Paraburkholderia sp. D15]WGS54092.1 transglycosylase SLT domain-containing protein [Paraburkholderia sp. D15]